MNDVDNPLSIDGAERCFMKIYIPKQRSTKDLTSIFLLRLFTFFRFSSKVLKRDHQHMNDQIAAFISFLMAISCRHNLHKFGTTLRNAFLYHGKLILK